MMLLENRIEDLKTQIVKVKNTNLNDYKTEGRYYFSSAYTPLNIPEGLVNGWLEVFEGDGSIKQLWHRFGTINSNDFQIYIRTFNVASSVWSNWRKVIMEDDLYYKSDDTFFISEFNTGGILTNGKKRIQFSIPLPKRMDNVTPSIESGALYIRLPSGGYLFENKEILEGNTQVCMKQDNILTVNLNYTEEIHTVNNLPIGIQLAGFKINFT